MGISLLDDDNKDVELKEDDYGPNYADNKSWFVVKSVNFRIGDMVSIIEKVLSETTVGEKRRRRQKAMQFDARSRKNEQAGMLEGEVDNEDDSNDDEPLFKKKIQVSKKTKETMNKKATATEATCLEKNVAYNDATYYGVVVKVEHNAKACSIKVVYATMSLHSTNSTPKETQILNGKPETVTITKTKASLLCKSNAVAGTNEERRHYLSDKTKYPKNFLEWLDLDAEESARKAQETQATPEVLVGSNKEDNDDDNDKEENVNESMCCCGCSNNVSKSIHFCSNTNRRIMSFCMVTDDEGYASRGICRRCVL